MSNAPRGTPFGVTTSETFRASVSDSMAVLGVSGEEFERFTEAVLKRHPSALRLRNGLDRKVLPGPIEKVPWYPLGYRSTDAAVRPSQTIGFSAGDFFMQDAGSMLALAACDADAPPEPARMICDLCAAPGGKASALLESIGSGFLVANEPIKSRLAPLEFNLARTGVPRYCITQLDPQDLADRLEGRFDLVLADVPCSGQALLGKGQQSLAAISPKQVDHSAQRARRILSAALRLLCPGGTLVLSTCTFARKENEEQLAWLIDQDGVEPLPKTRLGSYVSDETRAAYRVWPHRHDCAGSFAASLTVDRTSETKGRRHQRKRRDGKASADFASWFGVTPKHTREAGAVIHGWPDDAPDWVDSIAASGPEIAYRTGQTWRPAHGAALRRSDELSPTATVEVDEASALKFLRGEPIPCEQAGWCVVRHQGRSLGWAKASRGIGKNHLPPAARISW